MGKEVGDTEQWIFPEVTLSDQEKKEILAAVTRLMVELMFSTHIYTFGGKLFRQAEGGPIGLRGTCALARVIMNVWDSMWEEGLRKGNIEGEDYFRYMDDGRIFLHPIKKGWRWEGGDLKYRE